MSVELKELMMKRKSEASRVAYVGSPQLIRAGSPKYAAVAQWGARVFTEICCHPFAEWFRWHIIKICGW